MLTQPTVKYLIYALVIILSVIAAILAGISPAGFTDIQNAYQGF
jgi:hypothetical protein